MITVYAFSRVPQPVWGLTRDVRVLWALEELGVSYELRLIDALRGDQRGPDYKRINPFGAIPAIEDGGFKLFESAAIVLYLAEKAGALLPRDAKGRAAATQWAFAALNTLEPPLADIFVIDKFARDEPWTKERRTSRVEQARARLAALEEILSGRPYLLGTAFSAPDILMTSVLRIAQHTDLLAASPNVAAFKARCEKRPAFEKVLREHMKRVGP